MARRSLPGEIPASPRPTEPWRVATIVLGVVSGILLGVLLPIVVLFVALKNKSCGAVGWPASAPGVTVPVPVPSGDSLPETPKWQGKIPAVIYQTHARRDVPPRMARAIRSIQDANPDFDYTFFDDAGCAAFMRETALVSPDFDARLRRVYDRLAPGAFRADIFRVALLYHRGGVYLDTGFVANRPLSSVLGAEDRFVSSDDTGDRCVYQAFLAAEPGHPVLLQALRLVVDGLYEASKRGKLRIWSTDFRHILDLTGPCLVGRAVEAVTGEHARAGSFPKEGVRLVAHVVREGCYSNFLCGGHEDAREMPEEDAVVFWTKYPGYTEDAAWYPTRGSSHYSVMVSQGRLFRRTNES